jgi:hypothetical protein
MEPVPNATTLVRPNRTMAKYSGVEKVSANLAMGLGRIALAGHGITVPEERDMDRLPWYAEQDGGECSSVGPGDIHCGEKHDSGGYVHRVGKREGEHNAHYQGKAGQNTHEQSQNGSNDQEQQVHGLKTSQKTKAEVIEHVAHKQTPCFATDVVDLFQ